MNWLALIIPALLVTAIAGVAWLIAVVREHRASLARAVRDEGLRYERERAALNALDTEASFARETARHRAKIEKAEALAKLKDAHPEEVAQSVADLAPAPRGDGYLYASASSRLMQMCGATGGYPTHPMDFYAPHIGSRHG